MTKSSTDQFWNSRASAYEDEAGVNISDTVQRDFEFAWVMRHLNPAMRLLEVGCGNGWVTSQLREKVAFVDGFDYAENMVERARGRFGETNNRFFHDSVLDIKNVHGPYDAALCVRVLINLRNVEEQKTAIRNIAAQLKPGGKLILIEGYRDGFEEINALRGKIGLPTAPPAPINFYSRLAEITPLLYDLFAVEDVFNTGLYDLLTRVVLPQLVGPEKAREGSDFHKAIEPVIHAVDSPELARFARLFGFVLAKK